MQLAKTLVTENAPLLTTPKQRHLREVRISDALDGVCATGSFTRYAYSPPVMVTACEALLADHSAALEEAFYSGTQDEAEVRAALCVESSKLCKSLWTPGELAIKSDPAPPKGSPEAIAFDAKEKAKAAQIAAAKQAKQDETDKAERLAAAMKKAHRLSNEAREEVLAAEAAKKQAKEEL
jgi:hypothetical protein